MLYVENDSALRRLLGSMLADLPNVDLIGNFGSAEELFGNAEIRKADAALIDFALDENGLNGIELGIALRIMNENLGVVIYSQYRSKSLIERVPEAMRSGWSLIEKNSDMAVEDYVDVLLDSCSAKGNWSDLIDQNGALRDQHTNIYFSLSPRQRTVMDLAVQSWSAQDIAAELGISYDYVRKELSRAYAILLPNINASSDLKTAAVLKYLEIKKLR